MSSDDRIQDLASGELTTQPALQAVTERINTFGEDPRAFRQEMSASRGSVESSIPAWQGDLRQVRTDVGGPRGDAEKGFRKVERQMVLLTYELVKVRADINELEERVGNLEPKAS